MYNSTITTTPVDPTTGRENNHGLEGLTADPTGHYLYAMMQDSIDQEGGTSSSNDNLVRLLQYDISVTPAVYLAEYIIPLPMYASSATKNKTASQS